VTSERLGEPVVVGEVTVTPVERVSIGHRIVGGVVLFYASKRAVAVVVRTPTGELRLELEGD
jgi:hypothetical protein